MSKARLRKLLEFYKKRDVAHRETSKRLLSSIALLNQFDANFLMHKLALQRLAIGQREKALRAFLSAERLSEEYSELL